MSTSYIEEFLEQTQNLPREITRNLKYIKDLDEKYLSKLLLRINRIPRTTKLLEETIFK